MLSFALLAYGIAFLDADPDRALEAMRRGLVIAQDSGNRFNETHLAQNMGRVEAQHGDPLAALEYLTLAIRHLHDSGNTTTILGPLAILAAFFDRLGRYEGGGHHRRVRHRSPFNAVAFFAEIGTAIARLRNVLGEATYGSLARKGEALTTSAMATYAYDQIDQARAELNEVSK